jgi:2-polyprenyl-3-methyl-5-hydroxy-6-metoxy-1,4-benzoquinol methylase
MVERIVKGDGLDRRGHEFRYLMASGFCTGAVVLDAACGTGYGASLLGDMLDEYVGVDRELGKMETPRRRGQVRYVEANLDVWVPDFEFDVFVCFETLEHVKDPQHLLDIGSLAKYWMILSVPIVPTKHVNPYHLHDFEPGYLQNRLIPGWEHYQTVVQPSEVSEITVFGRCE